MNEFCTDELKFHEARPRPEVNYFDLTFLAFWQSDFVLLLRIEPEKCITGYYLGADSNSLKPGKRDQNCMVFTNIDGSMLFFISVAATLKRFHSNNHNFEW